MNDFTIITENMAGTEHERILETGGHDVVETPSGSELFIELCSHHPLLKNAMDSIKCKPNKIGTSESKDRMWKLTAAEFDVSEDKAIEMFAFSRGVQQQFGNNMENILASAKGWEHLKIGNETKCDTVKHQTKEVMEVKAHDNTTTGKHRKAEKAKGYKWAKENGYSYIYANVDVEGTDSDFPGRDEIHDDVRILSKKKLFEHMFGRVDAWDIVTGEYWKRLENFQQTIS